MLLRSCDGGRLGPRIIGSERQPAPPRELEPRFLAETALLVARPRPRGRARGDALAGAEGIRAAICPAWTVSERLAFPLDRYELLLLLLDGEKLLDAGDEPGWRAFYGAARLLRPARTDLAALDQAFTAISSDGGAAEGATLALLQLLRRASTSPLRSRGQLTAPLPRPVARTVELMRERMGERLELERLAAHARLDPFALLRGFRQHLGLSPHRVLVNLRINEAKRRLRAGDGLARTALDLGFYDQSHFTNCFRRFLGMSPARYRSAFAPARSAAPAAGAASASQGR